MEGTSFTRKKLVVIGGGAAGFFCAVNAAQQCPSLHVIIVERSIKLLSKVKVSGGGRCNVTHACTSPAEMAKQYPRGERFLRKTLHAFAPDDTVHWFAERGVPLKTEKDGRIFPVSDQSQSIIDCLLHEAARYGVDIRLQFNVQSVHAHNGTWTIENDQHTLLEADYICVACGGYTKPEQFQWIAALGHTIEKPVPSLFTFNMPGHPLTALMGVAVHDVHVKIAGTAHHASGPLLITHWGMSGPVILRLSAWAARELAVLHWHADIVINWLPSFHEQSLRSTLSALRQTCSRQLISQRNQFALPSRLWEYLLQSAGLDPMLQWANLSDKQLHALVTVCCRGTFPVRGKTTFKEEFVTAGGVVTKEIDPATMQSNRCDGLYFAGEIMNVDGVTGGYNFQHAWTSGWLAAKHIAERACKPA